MSVYDTFEETIEAVKRFARSDARCFLLRERMREDTLVEVLSQRGAYYTEANLIHYPLWQELKRRLPIKSPLTMKFLMADAVHEMG